ncbi:PH domain-containing protein [Bacillus changyiensis]|uniref:PH domain-containing protein n=1 Tax=Bacillus changyiensis TaxID=3004103 RepID=UPI0022DED533|nr:PH domain-containing protein [Bacillus changyiensis]MDA1477791.1 PH domain-containing protein [Bacillus changyiensis]
MMSEPKRLHPAAMILNFFKGLIETVKNFIVPFGVAFFLNQNKLVTIIAVIVVAAVFISLIIISILRWRKFTYRIEEDELRIEEGLITRKKKYIPIERIQTINTSAGIIQQLFKLVKLQVETAGGGKEAEVSLAAITQIEADQLQKMLLEKKKEMIQEDLDDEIVVQKEVVEKTEEPPQNMVYKMNGPELLIAASTSSGIGMVISGIFAIYTQVDEYVKLDWLFDQFSFLDSAGVAVIAFLIFLVLFIAWLFSIVGMLLKYANFSVVRKKNELVISRGLIEKHQTTLPLKRVQAIKIKEGLIRQPFGYASITIVSAGGSAMEQDKSTVLFPIIKKKEVQKRLHEMLPDYAPEEGLNHLPKRALRRYLLRASWPVVAVIPLSIFFPPWGYLSVLLLPFFWLLGYLTFKDAGWKISHKKLLISSRFLGKTTVVMQKRRMQVYKVSRSYFQRRKKLVSIHTTIKSSMLMESFSVKDAEEKDSETIFQWYSYQKRANG